MEGVSRYELLRQDRLLRNQEKLISLGFNQPLPNLVSPTPTKTPRKRIIAHTTTASRRSTRYKHEISFCENDLSRRTGLSLSDSEEETHTTFDQNSSGDEAEDHFALHFPQTNKSLKHSPLHQREIEWSEEEDDLLLFFDFFQSLSLRALSSKLGRSTDQVAKRLAYWDFPKRVLRWKEDLLNREVVKNIVRPCFVPVQLWIRETKQRNWTYSDKTDFDLLSEADKEKWTVEWQKDRARFVRQILENKASMSPQVCEELDNLTLLIKMRHSFQPNDSEAAWSFYFSKVKPVALALEKKLNIKHHTL